MTCKVYSEEPICQHGNPTLHLRAHQMTRLQTPVGTSSCIRACGDIANLSTTPPRIGSHHATPQTLPQTHHNLLYTRRFPNNTPFLVNVCEHTPAIVKPSCATMCCSCGRCSSTLCLAASASKIRGISTARSGSGVRRRKSGLRRLYGEVTRARPWLGQDSGHCRDQDLPRGTLDADAWQTLRRRATRTANKLSWKVQVGTMECEQGIYTY